MSDIPEETQEYNDHNFTNEERALFDALLKGQGTINYDDGNDLPTLEQVVLIKCKLDGDPVAVIASMLVEENGDKVITPLYVEVNDALLNRLQAPNGSFPEERPNKPKPEVES